jgi:hypothetical protein
MLTIYSSSNVNKQFDIFVYPNPNSGSFTIKYNNLDSENIRFELMDITNRLLYSQNLPAKSHLAVLDVGHIKDGIYGYRILMNNEMIKSGHVIIIR